MAVYASLLHLMVQYPGYCATRTVLLSDLSELIGYDLLGLEGGFVDPNDDEAWEDKEVDAKLACAAETIRGWVWLPGEEWMGDALVAVVAGTGSLQHLPCKA